MPLLENLVQGLSHAAGSTASDDILKRRKDDRALTQHAELQTKSDAILNDVKNLQERRSKLPPDSPEIADIDQALHDNQQAFTDLYHPTKNPGALQHLGRYLEKHIARRDPKPLPASNAVTPERMAGLEASAAGTSTTPDQWEQFKKQYKQATGKDVPPEVAESWARKQGGVTEPKPPHLTDYAQGLRRFVESEGGDPDNPTAAQEQAFRTQRAQHPSNSKFSQEVTVYENQWGKKIAQWTPAELSYFNQKMAYDSQRAGESTTTRLEKDENGVIHPVEITNTHGPTKPPVDPHAAPSTPGAAKARAASVGPKSNVKVEAPLPFKGSTPAVTSAQKELKDAVGLDSIAKQVEQKPDDAVNQKRLAVALERQAAGRFTTQALDYIVKAGIANSIEGWINKAGTGALPKDVMRQLIEGAHQNLKSKQDALAAAESLGSNDDDEFLKKIK